MVGASVLASDVVQTVLYLALPSVLWLVVLWLAWTDPALARRSGFVRPVFWLLLPGAIIGTFSVLPIFLWNGDVLGVDVGGALLPVVVSIWLIGRAFGDRALVYSVLFTAFAVEAALAFVVEFYVTAADPYLVALGAILALGVIAIEVARRLAPAVAGGSFRRAAVLLALTNLSLAATFLTTQAIPEFGITSAFPWYLAIPVVLGAFIVGFAPRLLGLPHTAALGIAYAATTFGVLIGADLLREPPLYAHGGGILAIGGAGTNDLVFLSGLLAVLAGYCVLRIGRLGSDGPADWRPSYDRPEPVRPTALLRSSLLKSLQGAADASLRTSFRAVELAESQAAGLRRGTPPEPAPSLGGFSVPAWVVADRTNLAALAARGGGSVREAYRGWLTARWIVRFLSDASLREFAAPWRRVAAFLFDLAVVGLPGLLLCAAVSLQTTGSAADVLSSIPFNAAVYLAAAAGFLYFVLTESVLGTTFGKWVLGLEVRDRDLDTPNAIAALSRNLPKVVPLTLMIVGLSAVIALETHGLSSGTSNLVGQALATVAFVLLGVVGVGLPGLVSLLTIYASPERQRLGDWFAGTIVLNQARAR